MKKLRSNNWYYLLGTVPFTAGISVMTVMLVGRGWQKALVGAVSAGIIVWLICKFFHLPRARKAYGELEICELTLPVPVNAEIYLCPEMDRYEFLKRYVEIISPLFHRPGAKFKIAVSPEFLKQEGDETVRIALMREVIRYVQAAQARAFLGLVVPVLTVVSLVEFYYVFGISQQYPIPPGYLSFFGPLLIAAATICFLLFWNKQMSQMDYQTDDELKRYFSRDEITAYIKRMDERLLPKEAELVHEKSRQLELYYRNKRIERL